MHEEPAPAEFVPGPPVPSTAPSALPEEAAVAGSRTSGLAIASLVCSLLSFLTCVGWLPGLICGHLAKARIRRDPTLKGRGLATAGLIISYATLLVGAGVVGAFVLLGSAIFKDAYQQAEQIMATNKTLAAQTQNPSITLSNNVDSTQSTDSTQPDTAGWTMDVTDAQIPDGPITGEIHGQNFEFKRAILRGNSLKFTSADGAEYVVIRGLGAGVANQTFAADTNSPGGSLKVEIAWGENGQNNTQSFDSGYAMQLKFDSAQKRKVPGHIYLCLPDDSKSYLAGSFTVTLPKPKKPQPDQ
jgi:hypothetical protein